MFISSKTLQNLESRLFEANGNRRAPRCRKCGMGRLRWEGTREGWRLFNGDKPHVCPTINDFEEVT